MSIKSKTLCDKIRRNKPYFEDFITRSIYNSNAIEGNTLSYYDTYAIVFNDNSIIHAKPREIYEAINLKYAMAITSYSFFSCFRGYYRPLKRRKSATLVAPRELSNFFLVSQGKNCLHLAYKIR